MPRQKWETPAATAYCNGLSEGSRRTIHQSLESIALSLYAQRKRNQAKWDWTNITPEEVRALRRDLVERLAPATVNKMMAALRGLMREYRRQGLITELQYQAIAQIEPVKNARKKESRTLRDIEIKALFRSCSQDITATGRRDAALLAVMLTGGLRSEELTELNLADVDLAGQRYLVRSAVPERERWVQLGRAGTQALRDWIAIRGNAEGALLCPVDKGGTIRLRRLTGTALLGILSRRSKAAGIDLATTRDLRRTLIVRLIAAGMDLEHVRERVGHLSWFTTGTYQDFADDLKRLGPVTLELPYAGSDGQGTKPRR